MVVFAYTYVCASHVCSAQRPGFSGRATVLPLPQDRVPLCSPGCLRTHSVALVDLELRDPPTSASWVLGLRRAPPRPAGVLMDKPSLHSSLQASDHMSNAVIQYTAEVLQSLHVGQQPGSSCGATKWHTSGYQSTWNCFGWLLPAMSQVNGSICLLTAPLVLDTMFTNSMQFKKMTEPANSNHFVCSNVPHDCTQYQQHNQKLR